MTMPEIAAPARNPPTIQETNWRSARSSAEVDPETGHGAGHVTDRHMEEPEDADVHEARDASERGGAGKHPRALTAQCDRVRSGDSVRHDPAGSRSDGPGRGLQPCEALSIGYGPEIARLHRFRGPRRPGRESWAAFRNVGGRSTQGYAAATNPGPELPSRAEAVEWPAPPTRNRDTRACRSSIRAFSS
jgi:hypothetical protein